ncbi:MAG: ABC transporter ATP-binding protein [Lachnospira sp.]|nr:ABC transporter ATP-binding protein [Lachnospira sp.]
MKGLKRYLSYIGKYKYSYWTVFVITLFAASFLEVAYSYMNKLVFGAVEHGDRERFLAGVIICATLVIMRCLFPYLRYFQIRIVRKIVFDIKIAMFEKMLRFNMGYYEQNHSGDALKTLNWDANSLKDSYFSHIYWVTGKLTTGMTAVITMLWYSPSLALVSIGFSIITVYISVSITKQIKKMDKQIQGRISKLAQRLSDILSGFALLKMYRGASVVLDNYQEENIEVTLEEKKRVSKAALSEMIAFLMGILANFGTIIVGAIFVARGRIDYGTVMAVVSLQLSVSSMVQRFGGALTTFSSSLVKAGRVFDFLEMEGQEEPEEQETFSSVATGAYQYPVTVRDLNFSYDNKTKVFDDFNLNISEGEKILLMGDSGCGKSTFLKLLMRFYEKCSGEIQLYGQDITKYPIAKLRDMITYVPQSSYLFEGTIRDNIAYGCKDGDVVEAARLAYADEFIKELPLGYDTPITAGGTNLSGGQRQRIAIARAFMKNSPILLLDEPSSALDVQSEKMINLAMKQLMKNRIVIMVTHRMTSFEEFDRVVEMK